MPLRRLLLLGVLLVVLCVTAFALVRWRTSARAEQLTRLRAARVAAEAYPRRLAGEHDAAVTEKERLVRAIEEVEAGVGARFSEAQQTTAMRGQTRRISTILDIRRRSEPLAAKLNPPRPPGEDDD